MLYIIIVALITTLIIKFDFNDNLSVHALTQKFFWFNILLVVLVLLAAFGAIGGDFPGYYQEYKAMPNLWSITASYINMNSYYRPGWLVFLSFCKTISPNYLFFHLVHALFVNIIIFRFIKKNTEFIFFSILFYFILNYFEFNFESIRETMAISFVLLGIDYLDKKKWYVFFFFALIAIGFHESAIISLLIPFLYRIQKIKLFRLTLLITVLVGIVYFINNNIQINSFIKTLTIQNKIDNFFVLIDFGVNFKINYWLSALPKILLPLIALYIVAKHFNKRYKYSGMIIFLIVLLILYAFTFSKIFSRLSNYFMPFYWIILSQWMGISYKKMKKKLVLPILFVITSLVFFVLIYQNSQFWQTNEENKYWYSRYYPYKSIITYTE